MTRMLTRKTPSHYSQEKPCSTCRTDDLDYWTPKTGDLLHQVLYYYHYIVISPFGACPPKVHVCKYACEILRKVPLRGHLADRYFDFLPMYFRFQCRWQDRSIDRSIDFPHIGEGRASQSGLPTCPSMPTYLATLKKVRSRPQPRIMTPSHA